MKRVLSIVFWLTSMVPLLAQAPLGFNYQGIARESDGTPISNQMIGIRVSITEGANGTSQFTEEHFPETNEFGLFTLVVGQGNGSSTLNSVDWSGGNLWLQIELDPDNSGSYILMGSQQLMSVPYALYSQQSGGGLNPGYGLDITNGTISNVLPDVPVTISAGDNITVSGTYPNFTIDGTGTTDGDADATNELQTISKIGNEVTLSDGGGSFTDEVNDADADATNEIQDLQLVGNNLTITKNGTATTIDLSAYLDNTDTQLTETEVDAFVSNNGYLTSEVDADVTNEIQDLQLVGNNLVITNNGSPTTIDLSPYLDNTDTQLTEAEVDAFVSDNGYLTSEVDGDATNEIQDLQLVGNNLTITNNGSPTTIDLSPYLDNTDTQLTEAEVDAYANNNGYLTSEVDGSTSNEIQDLQLAGNILTITNNGTATNIDLGPYLDNTDNQNLSSPAPVGTNRTINISGGSGVTISVADNDNSASNELITNGSYQANNTLRLTEGGINTDVSLGTLNADLNADNNTITNLADPVNGQDAVNLQYLETKDAADYAISAALTHAAISSGDVMLDLSGASLDKGGLISGSTITITEPGVYAVSVQGYSNLASGSDVDIEINGSPTTVLKGTNVYLGNYLFDLSQNDTIEIVVRFGGAETVNLQLSIYKI